MLKKAAFFFTVGSLPVLFFFGHLWRFSTPFPNEDDIPAILAFINHAFLFTDESQRLLFVPFSEHFILPAKIIFSSTFHKKYESERNDSARKFLVGPFSTVALYIDTFFRINRPIGIQSEQWR